MLIPFAGALFNLSEAPLEFLVMNQSQVAGKIRGYAQPL